jgi:hypothetical protein
MGITILITDMTYPKELAQLPIAFVENKTDSCLVFGIVVVAPRYSKGFALLSCPISNVASEGEQFVYDIPLLIGSESFKRLPRLWGEEYFRGKRHESQVHVRHLF